MNICVLGSTSEGNCTAIWNDDGCILVDCGLKLKYTETCLSTLGLNINKISAVILTHCHSDHVSDNMVRKLSSNGIPVLCHMTVKIPLIKRSIACADADRSGLLKTFGESWFTLSSFAVQPFQVPHDAPGGCYGFKIYEKKNAATLKCSIATDIGMVDDDLPAHFINSDIIIIESNHDVSMLEDSDRAIWLKKRIRKAHLSNQECSDLIRRILAFSDRRPSAVILTHLSEDCNTHENVRISLESAGLNNEQFRFVIAGKNDMTPVISI